MSYQAVFVVGAPRSGTTWVQQMLGAHPRIVTPQELGLFSAYLRGLTEKWDRQLDQAHQLRYKGLPAVLTQRDFDDLIREIIDHVHQRALALKASASVLVEKEPGYSNHVQLIRKYMPDARFIHVLRDGRDVVASMLAASKGWGQAWAPNDVSLAARAWRSHVLSARKARDWQDCYLEIRYEDLLANGALELRRLFSFCGVEATAAECLEIHDRFAFDRMRSGSEVSSSIVWGGEIADRFGTQIREPDGFFREGRAGSWQDSLRPADLWCFDKVAGQLLSELGYAESGWRGGTRLTDTSFAVSLHLRDALRAVRWSPFTARGSPAPA